MKKNYQRKTCLYAILLLLLVFTSFYSPVNADNDEYAYIGGEIVGFEADIGGALVTSSQNFDSGEWSVKPIFLPGDVIKSINGCRVYRVDDIAEILNGDDFPENNIAEVEFLRGGSLFCERITAGYGKNDNKRVLGVTAKDCVCGLGTMTFVRGDGSFAALGHAISDYDTGFNLLSRGGKIVEATVSGIDKSGRGAPGTIKGYLCSKRIGMIEKSGKFGIIGRITQSEPREEYKAKLGGKKDVGIGSAKICSCISGKKEFYDIKIVKAFSQRDSAEKSMIIRVSDKRLIDYTGGIVQGMSGSPIIQNGIIVGAVTHVFTNDPTMGYGVYADWQR